MPQFYRQKFLLALLSVFGNRLHKTDFIKYLFLYSQQEERNPGYYFLPYEYGPFSFQAYADLRRLSEMGLVNEADQLELSENLNYFDLLKETDKKSLLSFYYENKNLHGEELLHSVYNRFPYFASKSRIKDRFIKEVNTSSTKIIDLQIFTLGYEGITFDEYLNMLILNNINAVVDVRKNPVSMKYGFSKKTLSNALTKLEIKYFHLPELGIESEYRQNLDSFEQYQVLFRLYEETVIIHQEMALKKIMNIYEQEKRIVLTCFEKDYKYCHRSVISKCIENMNQIKVNHLCKKKEPVF